MVRASQPGVTNLWLSMGWRTVGYRSSVARDRRPIDQPITPDP
ncbi:hypothetical protein [Prochlorothrix hollandica]